MEKMVIVITEQLKKDFYFAVKNKDPEIKPTSMIRLLVREYVSVDRTIYPEKFNTSHVESKKIKKFAISFYIPVELKQKFTAKAAEKKQLKSRIIRFLIEAYTYSDSSII